MAAASGSADPRLERAFELVPREAFLPPGPWKILAGQGDYRSTPSADPAFLYQNALVAIDAGKGINNGEPMLHARWIGAVAPQPGETVTHIGAGMGYYSAILSILVLPEGHVSVFEIEPKFAKAARANLAAFENVLVTEGDAGVFTLPPSDVIYVNAGLIAPPVAWLEGLKPGGRMIFPWRAAAGVAVAMLVTRRAAGFDAKTVGSAIFIPCSGAAAAVQCQLVPDMAAARRTRSVRMTASQAPDASATAIYDAVWFSAEPVAA